MPFARPLLKRTPFPFEKGREKRTVREAKGGDCVLEVSRRARARIGRPGDEKGHRRARIADRRRSHTQLVPRTALAVGAASRHRKFGEKGCGRRLCPPFQLGFSDGDEDRAVVGTGPLDPHGCGLRRHRPIAGACCKRRGCGEEQKPNTAREPGRHRNDRRIEAPAHRSSFAKPRSNSVMPPRNMGRPAGCAGGPISG